MRPKGISPVIASIILVLVVIALASSYLVFTGRLSTSQTEAAQRQSEEFRGSATTLFHIEEVRDQIVVVVNDGLENIPPTAFTVFVGDRALNYTLASGIDPGERGELNVSGLWLAGRGDHRLTLRASASSDSLPITVEVEKDGRVLDLRFEEGSGNTVNDASGNDNDGTLTNMDLNSVWTQGKFGKALSFDGTDDYVNTPYRVQAGPRSVFLWIKYNSLNGPGGYALTGTQEAGAYTYTGVENGGQGYSYLGNTGGPYSYFFTIGRWYFVGLVADGSTVKYYVDGTQVDTRTYTSDATATQPFLIGRVFAGHNINGLIDEVRVYNRVLTPGQLYVMKRR